SQPRTQHVGAQFDDDHDHQDLQDDHRDVVIGIEAAPFVQQPPDTAGTDDTQDRRDAYVQLQGVQPLVGVQGPGLWQQGELVDLALGPAGGPSGFDIGMVGGVDRLGDELDHHAQVEQEQGKETGQGPYAHDRHQYSGPHRVRDRASDVDDQPHDLAGDRIRVAGAGGPQCHRYGNQGGESGAGHR